MTSRQRALVDRELRAIKRTIARIHATFEGVPKLLSRVMRDEKRSRVYSRTRRP